MRLLRDLMVSLALADHLGDVNDVITDLCNVLGLPAPEWSERYERWVFAWEPARDEDDA